METPTELEDVAGEEDEILMQEREYDGETEIVVDFGSVAGTPSLDVVGDTAIVVAGDEQFEFHVPEDATDVTVNEGVLTIRG